MNMRRLADMLTFYDKMLIVLILIVSISVYGIATVRLWKTPDDAAVVRQGEAVVLKLTQEKLKKDGIYDFEFDGGVGQVEVKDGKVRMLPMDKTICPRAICSDTGWIEGSPNTIVCVPNRLILTFISDTTDEIDGVAF